MTKEDLIEIRPPLDSDLGFIYSTWLIGLRHGNQLFELIDEKTYFNVYRKVLGALLERPSTLIRVACLKEDNDVVLGYSVSDGDKLHWIYCKEAWRKLGIAKSLLPEFKVVTHLTKQGLNLLQKKHPGFIFDPFLI